MRHLKKFDEGVFGKVPKSLTTDILDLNNSEDFKREKVQLSEYKETEFGLADKIKNKFSKSIEFYIKCEKGKTARFNNHEHRHYVAIPMTVRIDMVGSDKYKVRFSSENHSSECKLSEVVPCIKSELIKICKKFDEYQKRTEVEFKDREAAKKKLEREKERIGGKISKEFIADHFSDVFDLCSKYTIGDPIIINSKNGPVGKVKIVLNVDFKVENELYSIDPVYFTQVDSKFIEIYSELLTTAERLKDENINMCILSVKGGIVVLLKEIDDKLLLFPEEKKSDALHGTTESDYDPDFDGRPAHHAPFMR